MALRVLVTGASGYIATHIVQQLQRAGHIVRGTVRNLQNEEKVKPLKELCTKAEHPLELVEADLNDSCSWENAVKDCNYVFHVASPFVIENPRDENELIKPAVEGTLNVLQACKNAKTVKRVILTSSSAAVSAGYNIGGTFTEENWTDVSRPTLRAYHKSKTLAEKSAWDFMKELNADEKFELTVINPVYVMGPVLCGPMTASMVLPKKLLEKSVPMIAHINFAVADVRDVAAAHVAALTCDEAVGHRHVISGGNIWASEMANIMSDEFKPQGYSIPTRVAPYAFMWVLGIFDKDVNAILPSVGKIKMYDTTRMQSVLGINPRPIKDTVLDMCYTMIEQGKVKKTSGYNGPKYSEQ